MYKPESLLENETYEILLETNHPVSTRRSDLVLINKKKRT